MRERQAEELMFDCFLQGVWACHPERCLEPHLPPVPENGKIILLAGGKAAGAMMKVAARHYLRRVDKERICGVAVGKPDARAPIYHMSWMEAGHPVPDEGSQKGALQVLHLARRARAGDLAIVLLSGGASSLWSAPVEGVSLADKQQLTRDLLHSGATINEINCVRKHLSKIKGGRLAKAVAPAKLVTLAISDVVGDGPSVIASGPTCSDPTCLQDARGILANRNIHPPAAIERALLDEQNETPFEADPLFEENQVQIIANGATALQSAQARAEEQGINVINLGAEIEGEAKQVAAEHARLARIKTTLGKPVALLSGGELTVTVRGKGRGGPNQEYALALAMALQGTQDIYALAADSDGCDGGSGAPDDPAGAMVFPSTLARARAAKLNPATFLADNDSGAFFKALDDLVFVKKTNTNVNDFRLILINNTGRK